MNLRFLFNTIYMLVIGISMSYPLQSFAMSCRMQVKYDIIRMTTGNAARELYEKLYSIPSKQIPSDQQVKEVQIDLKEVSFYEGSVKIRVARVLHNEFNLEDITSSEPLYYAQIVVNRSRLQSVLSVEDSSIKIKLHHDTETSKKILDDNGNDLASSFKSERIGGECFGGVCASGKYFVKWRSQSWATDLILPFGVAEGTSSSPQQINIINKTETFWGDVKKTMLWFFNS